MSKKNTRELFAVLLVAALLNGCGGGGGDGDSAPLSLIIDAFRLRGLAGANDEYVQVVNPSASPGKVRATSGTGYAIVASDGIVRCTIPNDTVIPGHGHFLCVNSMGYGLAATAAGDATFTVDIPDNAGIAVFNNNTGGAKFNLANRLDAVGSTTEANTLYREGTGVPAFNPVFSIDYSWVRDLCGKGGSITTAGACPSLTGVGKDTGNNAADFYYVDTNGTATGGQQRLGAAAPRNLSSPVVGSQPIAAAVLDSCATADTPPNRARDFTSDAANNSTFGTLEARVTFTNNTSAPLTRLRFRIVDITTFPAPSGFADLRPRTSTSVVVTVDRPPCGAGTSNINLQGTTLEAPPDQINGGGFNSTLVVTSITPAAPLAVGASIDVRFLIGIQQTGNFRVGVLVESLPDGGGTFEISGATG
jgi:hypothetical protein